MDPADFEQHRGHLRAVAHRMLGSLDEAEDAVQETWLRAARASAGDIESVRGWLTTIAGRVCLDLLRARRRRREEATDLASFEPPGGAEDPAEEAALADSVGLAMLVVLDRLGPAERVAFVLHDVFAVPFEQIAGIVERTPATTKKLASRARQRIHGTAPPPADLARQRTVVEAFLAASRAGDLDALLAVLDPDAVRRAGGRVVLRGAERVAEETAKNAAPAAFARLALLDGTPGLVVAPLGHLKLALKLTLTGNRVTAIDVFAGPTQLGRLEIRVFPW
ncbi:sigma-70 family RNA polymerase sigma factor [Phytohabitans houttuyneae]|uniref:DNA-directed RNA polymerase sigma-70 factor n=1 Tax=Phytohabitans houttuyneae TaxID=1076126 RepID=A0A6V8K8D1_9ACTN|nr:sigma-70 family RNA polymerase sigma factor [Phytohabitans houttuyneae]GFJ78548.1 DNA-directed RNA polymerase sigma-70 factor [Phytohabitans houttuyneae]